MENFSFIYDDEEEFFINSHHKSNLYIEMINPLIYHSAQRDINALCQYNYPYRINITCYYEHVEIEINNESKVIAYFELIFNEKYPLEAPLINFIKPNYNFYTKIQLSYNFEKCQEGQWNINESIDSIIREIINIIHNQSYEEINFTWNHIEMICIDLMKELGYFKDRNRFLENMTKQKGQGIGYGNESDEKGSIIVEQKNNIRKSIWKKSIELISNLTWFEPILEYFQMTHQIIAYIQQNSYLNIDDIKENLISWKMIDQSLKQIINEKTNLESVMNLFQKNEIIVDEEEKIQKFVNINYYKLSIKENHTFDMRKLYRRIVLEMADLEIYSQSQKSNFRFVWCPEHFQLLQFVVTSENEPYIGGFFIFHLFFPYDYPLSAPKIQLITTNGNTIRFNPNLYNNGKVCLSLLGTWSGEQWNPHINNIVHIIQAITVMILTDQPIMNEPAYSSMEYFDDHEEKIILHDKLQMVKKYKYDLKYHVFKYALLSHFKNPDPLLGNTIQNMIFEKKDDIRGSFNKLLKECTSKDFKQIIKAKSFQSNDDSLFVDYMSHCQQVIQEIDNYLQ
jgi:ubiquitin-protein ligase